MRRGRLPTPYLLAAIGLAAALAAFAWLGAGGLVLAAVAGALALVWRYDNWTGSCLMLTVLFLIVVAILILLLVLLALHR